MNSLLCGRPESSDGYRNDIDGLRSIAVLSVIVFHLNERWLPGGFIGVDIFFVISGYLITLHILREIQDGWFSIAEFYRRRIKRIAPAMFAVLLVVLLASQWIYRPTDAEDTAHAAFWSILSLANVYFWHATDDSYFAGTNEEQPLLHYWSLGVEEQFYVLWPLILIAVGVASRSRAMGIAMATLALTSFALGEFLFASSPSFVYYMLPSRACELLVGALVAWWTIRNPSLALVPRYAGILGVSSIIVIAASFWFIDGDDVFPGFNAMPATFATAGLIVAGLGKPTFVTSTLSIKPLVMIGTISYSAYLWHWPIISFTRYALIDITPLVAALIVTVTLSLSALSYRFIETPFRRTKAPISAVFLRQFVIPGFLLLGFSGLAMKTDGLALHNLDPKYVERLSTAQVALQPAYGIDDVCQLSRVTPADLDNSRCVLGDGQESTSVLLWGDSNAAHYIGMLEVFATAAGYTFRNIEVGACPPLDVFVETLVPAQRHADCEASTQIIWSAARDYETVIVSANWTYYAGRSDAFWQRLERTLRQLTEAGSHVILIGKAPIIDGFDRRCFEKKARLTWLDCDVPRRPLTPAVIQVNDVLRGFSESSHSIEYFDANSVLCPEGQCGMRDVVGEISYFDSHHMTHEASIRLGRLIIETDGIPPIFDISD